VLELEKERAPVTTANFLKYVDLKRYDGIGFYRSMKIDGGYGLIQAGIRNDIKKWLPPIKHESTTQTGLSHLDGTISMAREAPGTAVSDFFIVQTCGFGAHLDHVAGEHQAVIEAIAARQPEQANAAARAHIESVSGTVATALDVPNAAT